MSEQQQGDNRSSDMDEDFDQAIEAEVEVLESGSGQSKTARLPIILAGLALLAVIASLVFGYRYWVEMKSSLEQMNRDLAEANQQQSQFAERLMQSQQAFAKQQQQIAEQQQALVEQSERVKQAKEAAKKQDTQLYRSLAEIQTKLGGREGQWRVAEAEYLIRVANHRVSLMGDVSTALEALKSADERLSASGDPVWSGVREQLAREITQLKAVPIVDQAGISAELTALADQVERLPLHGEGIALIANEKPAAGDEPVASEGLALEQIVDDLWQGFKSMMVIRHHDRPVSAMLPPEQRYFLIQNLRLKLENAKAALMGQDASLYQDSLNGALAWLKAYFLVEDPGVSGFKGQLEALVARDIAPQLPDISASLRVLQKQRQQLSQGGAQ
ncbi:MAG: uroporphyrinogen-III C-methyltransferase [Candidatus Thiodiazotropha taylori]|nr:uroporphyrinogen-III C-methyltransferase [Candidatus Thiodiazotropha taylori]MCG7935143.1 uroporphyrinogen-III C-methyltransferase [Candidatus Thiodiazotropha taylori]MCG7969732.1 uroporphyrinogen-III C-methyltransferase [Candidatus Thiodiazotropha taylori]